MSRTAYGRGRRGLSGGRGRREAGAATVLVVALAGLLVLVGAAVAGAVGLVSAHRAAQSAADLAALAGATALEHDGGGATACGKAAAVADANQARLVSCHVAGDDVTVRVSVTAHPWAAMSPELAASARAGPGG